MSKAVLISIQPKWCELIASGKKTIEVRKTRPNLETPFKCYIYCTSVKNMPLTEYVKIHSATGGMIDDWHSKVIGEFVYDKVERLYIPISNSATPSDKETVENATCLSFRELKEYANVNMFLYGWHISDIKIYDKPKELREFRTPPCEKSEDACDKCKHKVNVGTYWEHEFDCDIEDGKPLARPPQSWCYVEKPIK